MLVLIVWVVRKNVKKKKIYNKYESLKFVTIVRFCFAGLNLNFSKQQKVVKTPVLTLWGLCDLNVKFNFFANAKPRAKRGKPLLAVKGGAKIVIVYFHFLIEINVYLKH